MNFHVSLYFVCLMYSRTPAARESRSMYMEIIEIIYFIQYMETYRNRSAMQTDDRPRTARRSPGPSDR